MKTLTALALVLIVALTALPAAAQQGGVTRYVYDQNGRLHAVIAPNGEAAVYEYDPAGNFTAIRRLGTNACEALEFAPRQGPFGTKVTIYGAGFKGQVRAVSFNGVEARITSQTPASVIAEVPSGSTTGPIIVTAPCRTFTLRPDFIVSGVQVVPLAITLLPGRSIQFTANVAGLVDPSVEWSVNEVKGGNPSVGTITASGIYIAPASAVGAQFMVRATSVEEPSLSGEALVRVPGEKALELLASAVSVRYGPPPPNNNAPAYLAGNAVSVRYGPLGPNNNSPAFLAGGAVSVRYGPLPPNNNAPAYLAGGAVSVRYGPLPPNNNASAQIIGSAVSARYGAPPNIAPTSKQSAPAISSISVAAATEDRPLMLTIKGKNLSRATEIKFFSENGAVETNIAVTKIEANPSGDALTVEATVKEGASRGRYIVQVMTDAGSSPAKATKSNTIEIVF
jgi:YD repeat-containing protein